MIYLKYDVIMGLEYWVITSPYYDTRNSKKQGKTKFDRGTFKFKSIWRPRYRKHKFRESEDAFAPKRLKKWGSSSKLESL